MEKRNPYIPGLAGIVFKLTYFVSLVVIVLGMVLPWKRLPRSVAASSLAVIHPPLNGHSA